MNHPQVGAAENGSPACDDEHHPEEKAEEMNHAQVPAANGAPAVEHHPDPEEMNHPQVHGFGDVSEAEAMAQWRLTAAGP